jgi:hypothetical protein
MVRQSGEVRIKADAQHGIAIDPSSLELLDEHVAPNHICYGTFV